MAAKKSSIFFSDQYDPLYCIVSYIVVILNMLIFRKRNNLCNQSSDIGVEDDEIEIIEQSSLNDSGGGHAEEHQHSVSQIVSTTEYDSSRYGHSNGSFETGMLLLTSACAHFLYKARLLNGDRQFKKVFQLRTVFNRFWSKGN